MSDCGVCLCGPEDGVIEVISESTVTARKPFKCCECRRTLPPGTEYEKIVGKFEGEFLRYRTCLDCANIRRGFSCNGWVYTQLWEEFEGGGSDDHDALFQSFSESCVAKVETASAKAYIAERWRKWKGLAA